MKSSFLVCLITLIMVSFLPTASYFYDLAAVRWHITIWTMLNFERLYFLFKFVDGFEITANGIIEPDLNYNLKYEEDEERLNWEPIITSLRELITSSQSPQGTIDQLKKNLKQLTERVWGDKAEDTLRTALKSIKFSEVKEISDTLFRYKFIEKVMEKIREIDERMFDDLKKDLFQGFGNFSINEDKTAESTINVTVVPGGIRVFYTSCHAVQCKLSNNTTALSF